MRHAVLLVLVMCVSFGCQDVSERRTETAMDDVSPSANGLKLTVSPIRTVFGVSGPLEVEVTVLNLTDSVVTFRPIFDFGDWLDAEISGPLGSPIPKTAFIDAPNAFAISLESGESVTEIVDLRCTFPIPEDNSCMAPYDLSAPGGYEVKVRFTLPYYSPDYPDDTVLPVTLEAEPFSIRVEGHER